MQPSSHVETLQAAARARLPLPPGGAVLFASAVLIVLGFVPLVPPVGALEGGGMTARGAIEFGLILSGTLLLGLYAKARDSFAFDLRTPSFLLISLFVFWAVVSSLWSFNPFLSVAKGLELWCIAFAAVMFVGVGARTYASPRSLATVLALALAAVAGGLIVANLFIWGPPLPSTGDQSLPLELLGREPLVLLGRPRLILAYAHPLLTGDLLSLAAICLFASGAGRLLKALLIPALLTLLWLADARGPAGALVAAFAAMAVLKLGRNDVRAVALTLVVSACLAGAIFLQGAMPHLSLPLPGEDVSTLNSRTELWAKVWEHVSERPLVGYGFYASRYLLMRDFDWGGHAHNTFLEVLLTTGLVGLLILCAFVAHLCRACLRTKDCLLLGVVVYCLAQGMLNPLLFSPVLPMFVATVAVASARQRAGGEG